MSADDSVESSRKGTTVGGRYLLGERIGHGGASEVYEADDEISGRTVAVKLIFPGGPHIEDRARREIAALRLLRLPGVVTLQDEGVHDGAPFLVMERVRGLPFPGSKVPIAWPDLAAPALSMLETLARVHAAGVVHRDLKPSNVFVGPDLNVTLLDFGISWGPALGEALTQVGGIVGTPEYLAPEQLCGIRGDPRSDLYTVGILLYEALTGKLPHTAETFHELTAQKMTVTPVAVRRLSPDVPRRVAQTIERLLSREPEDRPQSVGELLLQLYDREVTERITSTLPRLGDTALPERVAEAVAGGASVDVGGVIGTGRSRLLADVAACLDRRGRHPRWAPPGTAPYASALALFDHVEDVAQLSREELESRLLRELAQAVSSGDVIFVDDPDQIDRWSAELFERARAGGGFVRVVDDPATPGCIDLERLSEEDLRPLFAGPDRIFHLREDAAAELHRRTGGLPSRVATEVGAWVRASLARWDGGRLVMTRDAIQQLAGGLPVITSTTRDEADEPESPGLQELLAWITLAWPHTSEDVLAKATNRPRWRLQPELEELTKRRRITRLGDGRYQPVASSVALRAWPPDRVREAHRVLADSLPPGSPDRLRHLTVSGSDAEVVEEAVRRGATLRAHGRYADAIVSYEQGLAAARRASDTESERRLLEGLAYVALDDGTPRVLQQALYDVGRALDRDEHLGRLGELLVIARDAETAPPEEVLRSIDALGPFEDLTLELWRRAQQFQVAMRMGDHAEADAIDDIQRWAESTGDQECVDSVATWRALRVMHAGRPLESAALQEAALDKARSATMRLTDLSNAAVAYLDAGDLDQAATLAARCRDEAVERRMAMFEATGESTLRQVAYRRGEPLEPDLELLDAIAQLGTASLEGHAMITEAAIAWRNGDIVTARRLAARCTEVCRRWGEEGMDALPRTLEILCGAAPEDGELERIEETLRATSDAELAVQALGLLALHLPGSAQQLHTLAGRRASELTYEDPAQRCLVLSVAEASGTTPVERASPGGEPPSVD